MLRVDVASARICNINDEVLKWNVMSGAKNNDDDERKNQNASQRQQMLLLSAEARDKWADYATTTYMQNEMKETSQTTLYPSR